MKTSFLKSLLILKKISGLMIASTLMLSSNANQLSGDKGPYVLTQKLAQKGISKSTTEEILKEFDFSEVAQRVANKLLKNMRENSQLVPCKIRLSKI